MSLVRVKKEESPTTTLGEEWILMPYRSNESLVDVITQSLMPRENIEHEYFPVHPGKNAFEATSYSANSTGWNHKMNLPQITGKPIILKKQYLGTGTTFDVKVIPLIWATWNNDKKEEDGSNYNSLMEEALTHRGDTKPMYFRVKDGGGMKSMVTCALGDQSKMNGGSIKSTELGNPAFLRYHSKETEVDFYHEKTRWVTLSTRTVHPYVDFLVKELYRYPGTGP